jgi:dUTP pyrophosphatase
LRVEYLHADMPRLGYAKPGDAGLDLVMDSWVDQYEQKRYEPLELAPGRQVFVGTGVKVVLPEGHYGRVTIRSGHGIVRGIVAHSGVIDAGYREEIMTLLTNLSRKPFRLERWDRVVQMVVQAYASCDVVEVPSVRAFPSRRDGGLGSTGN